MGMSVPELTESQNPRQMIDFPVSCAEQLNQAPPSALEKNGYADR
jgi:hypothetical protein